MLTRHVQEGGGAVDPGHCGHRVSTGRLCWNGAVVLGFTVTGWLRDLCAGSEAGGDARHGRAAFLTACHRLPGYFVSDPEEMFAKNTPTTRSGS
jgi:hypothetical protein